jgi:hypothetical protein
MQDELEERVKLAVQSILENESLTGDLDDEAAQALLDWGVACVRRIALETAGLDDGAAEASMASRLRATRRLMRRVSAWVSAPPCAMQTGILSDIAAQAAIIYGTAFNPVDEHRLAAVAELYARSTCSKAGLIARLRAMLEPGSQVAGGNAPSSLEESHEQKIYETT